MSTNRKPEEIEADILVMWQKLHKLEEELATSKAIHNKTKYEKYKNKWVFCNGYETYSYYMYVLDIPYDDDDDVHFYGYGVQYNAQAKRLTIIDSEYPEHFHIQYPEEITIIKEEALKDIFELLKLEFNESLNLNEVL